MCQLYLIYCYIIGSTSHINECCATLMIHHGLLKLLISCFENVQDCDWKIFGVYYPNITSVCVMLLFCCFFIISSPCQRQGELLPSLGVVVCHPLTFHILTFSSETSQPNELKHGRKHLWKVLSKD